MEEVLQGALAQAELSRPSGASSLFHVTAGWHLAVPWAYGTLPSILLCSSLLPKPLQHAPSSRVVLQNPF